MQVKTKNLVVGVLVAAFVGLVWYQFVYSPLEAKASKARNATHEADNTAAKLRHQLADAATAKKNAKTHDPSPSVMSEAVPADAAEASFLRSVDALRVTSGADWQSITPTVPAPTGTSSSINVGITVQGTQDQLLRYATGLEALKRIFVIDNLSLTGGTSGSSASSSAPSAGPAPLQMQISGRIFSQPAAAVATTGAAGTATGTAATPAKGAAAPTGPTAPAGTQNN